MNKHLQLFNYLELYLLAPPPLSYAGAVQASIQSTAIVDSGASNLYFGPSAPHINFNPAAPKINVGTATGQVQQSTGTAELNIPMLPAAFPKTGHVMPSFKHTLLGIGKICDADC